MVEFNQSTNLGGRQTDRETNAIAVSHFVSQQTDRERERPVEEQENAGKKNGAYVPRYKISE